MKLIFKACFVAGRCEPGRLALRLLSDAALRLLMDFEISVQMRWTVS
jgi:hypothetical protein